MKSIFRASGPKPINPWRTVAAIGGGAALSLAALGIFVYLEYGDLGLGANGYIALTLGAIGTALVGVALMSLVFLSDRLGYDDEVGKFRKDSKRR